MKIKTNKLSIQLDQREFEQQFDVFCIGTSEKYIKRGSYILDAPTLNDRVMSVSFSSGKTCLVLMRKADDNRTVIKEVLRSTKDDSLFIADMDSSTPLYEVEIVKLLLNALGTTDHTLLRFNNLTGHLYCFHPSWIEHGKKNSSDVIWKVHCLEIGISEEVRLTMAVRTFSSEYLKNKIRFDKLQFRDYPKYTLSIKNTIRRKLATDTGVSFIMRQTDGAKVEIPFLDIQNADQFSASKMGILFSVLDAFNKKYVDFASLSFSEIEDCDDNISNSRSVYKENEKRIASLLQGKDLRIVDQIGDAYSADYCLFIKELIETKYHIPVSIGKRVLKKSWNICIIHNAAYYDSIKDIHDKEYDAVVQHITLEDFKKHGQYAISTVIHELIIKDDLRQGKLNIFDWNDLKLSDDVIFGLSEEEKFFFMRIHPDGNFEMTEEQLDLFNMNEYSRYLSIFEEAKSKKKPIKGLIKDDRGNINVIRDTGWYTIPEISQIHQELSSGNTKLRNTESREKYLSAVLDIHSFVENGVRYYYVNDIGSGMQPKVRTASNIRQIERYDDSKDLFMELLSTMDVTFVRNGQLTVIPFPFKYLREYSKTR